MAKAKEQLLALHDGGFSYKRISELSGINYSTLRNFVSGYRDGMSSKNWEKLSAFLYERKDQVKVFMEVK